MDFSKCPREYEEELKDQLISEAERITEEKDNEIERINMKAITEKQNFLKLGFLEYLDFVCLKKYVSTAIIGGIILGLFLDLYVNLSMGKEGSEMFLGLLLYIIPTIIASIGALLIGARILYGGFFAIVLCPIFYPIYYSFCKQKNEKIELYNKELDQKCKSEIKRVESWYEEESEKLLKEGEKKLSDYFDAYNAEAEKRGADFENKELLVGITKWIKTNFLKELKTADRSCYKERVSVSMTVAVMENELRILVDDDEQKAHEVDRYNFEENRCEALKGKMTQAAFCRALAPKVQQSIMETCNKNALDSDFSIKIVYDYISVCALFQLTYEANNDKYEPVKQW